MVSALRFASAPIARPDGERIVYRSQLCDVSDEQFSWFIGALAQADDGSGPRPLDYTDERGRLGAFALRPLLLFDLGVVRSLRRQRLPSGARLFLVGSFTSPRMTRERFAKNPIAQFDAFVGGLRHYDAMLHRPHGMSRAGALGLLFCAGPNGIVQWKARPFAPTTALFRRVEGMF